MRKTFRHVESIKLRMYCALSCFQSVKLQMAFPYCSEGNNSRKREHCVKDNICGAHPGSIDFKLYSAGIPALYAVKACSKEGFVKSPGLLLQASVLLVQQGIWLRDLKPFCSLLIFQEELTLAHRQMLMCPWLVGYLVQVDEATWQRTCRVWTYCDTWGKPCVVFTLQDLSQVLRY